MAKRSVKPGQKVKKSRTRSGCFTCRDRHMKCDEQLPVCQNCINSKRRCIRGIRLNFTHYSTYDPKPAGLWNLLVPGYYKIIDQSIAIAKLYKDGYHGYKPYRHLHTGSDLAEARQILQSDLSCSTSHPPDVQLLSANPREHELDLQPEDLSQFFDTWLYSGQSTDFNSSSMMYNRIQENDDIKRILMNPELHDKQLGGVMHADFNLKAFEESMGPSERRLSFAAATAPEFSMLPEDAEGFISLIHQQKYFWLLDLFNDLRIWESCVPSYCVRLYQASDISITKLGHDDKFLLRCLLLCDENSSADRIIQMCQLQTERWNEFSDREVVYSTFQEFEKIVISVVLVLQAVLVQVTQSEYPIEAIEERLIMILANQGKLIHQLTDKYNRVPASTIKRLSSTVFTIASFQAIVILRFFLKKIFLKIGAGLGSTAPTEKDGFSSLEISYSLARHHDLWDFFRLTESEVALLCSNYNNFDVSSGSSISDSKKIRAQFWDLVLRDYQLQSEAMGPPGSLESDSEPQSETESPFSEDSTALIPNSRCLALSILSAYNQTTSGDSQMRVEAVKSITNIFRKIHNSAMAKETKAKWTQYFDWSNAGKPKARLS